MGDGKSKGNGKMGGGKGKAKGKGKFVQKPSAAAWGKQYPGPILQPQAVPTFVQWRSECQLVGSMFRLSWLPLKFL